MKHVAAVVLRLVVLVGAAAAVVALADLGMSDAEAGANIGAGLLAFAAVSLIALVWSFVDGHRAPRAGSRGVVEESRMGGASLAARVVWWAIVAVLLALLAPFQAQGFMPPFDTDSLASDAQILGPFHFTLVAIPAALGLTVGALTRRRLRDSNERPRRPR